jgi:hypothetical protein
MFDFYNIFRFLLRNTLNYSVCYCTMWWPLIYLPYTRMSLFVASFNPCTRFSFWLNLVCNINWEIVESFTKSKSALQSWYSYRPQIWSKRFQDLNMITKIDKFHMKLGNKYIQETSLIYPVYFQKHWRFIWIRPTEVFPVTWSWNIIFLTLREGVRLPVSENCLG